MTGFIQLAQHLSGAALALHLVYPAAVAPNSQANASAPSVTVQMYEAGDILYADFTVKTPTINAKKVLNSDEYPFMFDAVELFVAADGGVENLPYFEFELSPFDQTFDVKIIDPKKERINGIDVGLVHSVEHVPRPNGREWIGHMEIPLKRLGWGGERNTIVGNAFAILGPPHQRAYLSLFLPIEQKPNFHLPQYFRPLVP